MKRKNGTLYTLIIMFLSIALLTWFVPATTYSSEFVDGGIVRLGLKELITYPTYTFYNFIYIFMFLLLVGALYGILKHIKAYRRLVDKVVSRVKSKELFYIIATVLLFVTVIAFTGFSYEALAIMPFIATVVLLSGRDKVTAAQMTLGPIAIGIMGNLYSTVVAGTMVSGLQIAFKDLILSKIILLVLGSAILIAAILLHNRKTKDQEFDQEFYFIPEEINDSEHVRSWPLGLLLGFFVLIKIMSSIAWKNTFGLEFFEKLKTSITEYPLFSKLIAFIVFGLIIIVMLIKYIVNKKKDSNVTLVKVIGKCGLVVFIFSALVLSLVTVKVFLEDAFKATTVFTNLYNSIGLDKITLGYLLGEIQALGSWTYSEYIVWLFLLCILLKVFYKVKLQTTIDNMGSGIKSVLYASTVCLLAYTILVTITNNPVALTILKPLISLTSNMSVAPVIRLVMYFLSSLISSFLNSDFGYFNYGAFNLSYATNNFSSNTTLLPILGLIHQGTMGLAMLIAPTSVPMLFILNSLNLSYKEWLKRTWLLFVILLYLLLVISIIALLLI